tara:strand:+ start:64 stop:507 length:444 start_codon:yes stop_codon:yes gene_type:complete
MAADLERLVVSLEARTAAFEKAMNRANSVTQRETRKIESAFSKTAKVAASFGKGLFAGVAGAGLLGLASQVGAVSKAVAEVGDEARRAGVGIEAFQELGYVARQNRISMDALVDGLKELNLRADEFIVTGSGSAAEAFQRLGYTAED